jgi:hypothetical protein
MSSDGGGSGIGGGSFGNGGSIQISGGTVTATGGKKIAGDSGGAGIGGGYAGNAGTVLISGGVVFAARGTSGAQDVGNGRLGSGGTLEITDTAAVFLRNDSSLTPTSVSHTHETVTGHAAGGSAYGITVPWDGDFGAWLVPYTLSYDANGGSGTAPASATQHTGTTAEVSDGTGLSYEGYAFSGWNTAAGGGVCQLSSTTYNAAIRAALDITDATHHSISSDYIPLGFDATISTGGPDLKIRNPYDTPIYLISYVNPEEMNVTVEVYGQPVVDETYGDVILDFSSVDGGSYGTPAMQMVYNTPVAPDGTAIAPNASYVYAKARQGRSVQTYIHYLSLNGVELAKEEFHSYKWAPINGTTYINAAPPAGTPAVTAVPAG